MLISEKKKQNSLTENAKTLFTDMVKPLTDLFSVIGILKAIVAGANNFDKISVNTSKTLGYSAGRANDVARNFQAISLTSRSTNVTMKSLAEATNELSEATGLVSEYSAETLKTQIMLTKQFGLTGEEAAGIYKFSVLSGKSSEKVNDEMVGAFVASRNTLRVGVNFKAVMAEAAKVSGQLAANFRNNPAEITKAIVQAKALGTTLEQTKNQGEALLNFESSIENELKAELLIGQQLNLERARAAALQGDQVTVMKELANQGMTLEKFQSMNVLAQKSFAEALGLSADELSNQLNKQKIAQEQGKSLAQITAEEAEQAQKRQNVQDRFNAVMEKLMDMVGKIGILLQPFFRLFELITDNAFVLYGVLGAIAITRLPLIAAGFGGILGQVGGIGKGIASAFKGDGIKGFFSKVKEGFTGGFKGKGITEAATEGAEKTSTVADKTKGDNAEGFKTKMQNIAEGIKAFANTQVLKGALNLIPSAAGLILFIPGAIAAKLIEIVNGERFKTSMEGIANGIAAFGKNVTISDIGKLSIAGIALTLFSLGVPGLLLLQLVNGTLIEKSLGGVGRGIKAFSESIDLGKTAKAALGIALLGASLIPASIAFKMFAEVSWNDLAKAGVTLIALGIAGSILGGMAGQLRMGALAIAALGASLIPASIAFKMFADVKWEDMAKAGVALAGLALTAGILGSPPIIGFVLAGALALGSLGLALIPFALAARIATPAIEAFGNVISKAFTGIATVITAAANGISTIFTSLQNIDVVKLLAIGPALFGIGAGLASLGIGGALGAIGAFLTGDPIKKLEKLAATGDGLQKASIGLQGIASAITQVSTALNTLDTSKLDDIDEFASNRATESAIGGAIKGITDFITSPIKVIGEAITGTTTNSPTLGKEEGIQSSVDLTPMINAINEVKASIDKLYAKDNTINMDGRKVGTTLSQKSYKVA